jgi:L-rhamnose mutarotase
LPVSLCLGQPSGASGHIVSLAEFVPDGAPREGFRFFKQGQACGEISAGFGFTQARQWFEQGEEEGFLGGADADDPSGHAVDAGVEEEYEKRHSPIWSELDKVLKDHGVSNYSIFLHPETRQLFGYAEIKSEEQWAAIALTEICQRWWKHMSDVMPSNADHSPVSTPLREVFHLP